MGINVSGGENMIYVYPDYYKKFKCIASECPDTCCSQWQIVIDEDSLEKYKAYKGEYKKTLDERIDWREGVFKHNKNGKCAFLCDNKLCDMYINLGNESLCTTCREYPRHTEEFENVREISLSISCPEVARILMSTNDKMTFYTKEDENEEIFEDFDYFLFSVLQDIREEIIKILQNRDIGIRERIDKVLQIGASAQRHYDDGNLTMWDECDESDKVCVINEYDLLHNQALFLVEELEILYDDWYDVLTDTQRYIFEDGQDVYNENKKQFLEWWEKSDMTPLEIVLEQIIVYFISIYLPGAVYDENIIGKVEACIGHGIEIYMLLLARWIKKKESFGMNDLIELVYRYSREIEHSDENLEKVEILCWF